MQYIVSETGNIVAEYKEPVRADRFVRNYPNVKLEIIDEEEKLYRELAWCKKYGFEYDELVEENGELFAWEERHNYAHPSDEGASVDIRKVFVTYLPVEPSLQEAVNQMHV